LLAAERTCVLTQPILLLQALRLERQGAEHHDALTLLESTHDFGVIEVALSQLHDARVKDRFRAVRDEDESLPVTLRAATHLRRGRQRAALPRSSTRHARTCRSTATGVAAGGLSGVASTLLASRARACGTRVEIERRVNPANLFVDGLHFRAASESTAATATAPSGATIGAAGTATGVARAILATAASLTALRRVAG
jgi:hypothetical protein